MKCMAELWLSEEDVQIVIALKHEQAVLNKEKELSYL